MDIAKVLKLLDALNFKYKTHTHLQLFADHSGAIMYHKWNEEGNKFENIYIFEFRSVMEFNQFVEEQETEVMKW